VVRHRAVCHVDAGVHRRVCLQRLDHGLGEERQVGELHAFTLKELVLHLVAQVRDTRHVGLDHGRQLGGDLQ